MKIVPTAARAPAVADFLRSLAPPTGHSGPARGRLLVTLDATASREPTWDRACRIQGEMFAATTALGGLDVQLAYYRGYDECRASRWMTSAAELQRVMNQVRCAGGETQIEQILLHAIRESAARRVGAVVFIGDAMEEKLDRLCRLAGELGRLAVPLFMFHELGDDPAAGQAFEQLAKLSGGVCVSFDDSSAGRLRELLGAVAVYATGGTAALTAYAEKKGADVLQLTAQLRRE